MKAYPVLRSTLEGVFGSNAGLSDEQATSNFLKDLGYKPFRVALQLELNAALEDVSFSWEDFLGECQVSYFNSDDEARKFVVEHLQEPARSYSDG